MNMRFSILLPPRGRYYGIWLPMGKTHCVNSCLASHFDFGVVVCILECCTGMTDRQVSQMKEVVLSCCPLSLARFCSPSQGDVPSLTQMPGMRPSSAGLLSPWPFNHLCLLLALTPLPHTLTAPVLSCPQNPQSRTPDSQCTRQRRPNLV